MKKLKDVEQLLATFFAQGLLELGTKLGPILWQLPAAMPFDAGRLESFRAPEVAKLLRRWGVALVIADAPEWPRFDMATADFVYLRLHGATELYASGYDPPALAGWARRVRRWAAQGLDVFVYFDNDAKIRAPADARALAEGLGLTPGEGGAAPARGESGPRKHR